MVQRNDAERISQALAGGRLSLPDSTGMQHFIYARCPQDGQDSPVYRTEKSGEAVRKVIFRCPVCGNQFDVPPEEMFLR